MVSRCYLLSFEASGITIALLAHACGKEKNLTFNVFHFYSNDFLFLQCICTDKCSVCCTNLVPFFLIFLLLKFHIIKHFHYTDVNQPSRISPPPPNKDRNTHKHHPRKGIAIFTTNMLLPGLQMSGLTS